MRCLLALVFSSVLISTSLFSLILVDNIMQVLKSVCNPRKLDFFSESKWCADNNTQVCCCCCWCLMSSDVIWHIRDKLWPMPKHGSIRKVYACLAVTCHLHFWQNDRDFLRATVVTRGWNGYQNKSQHRKSTLEKKILPPFQQGFEPATFQSRVRCSNHWAIPAPTQVCPLMIAYIALLSALLSRLTAFACGSTWVTSCL